MSRHRRLAGAANLERTLEPGLVVLIRRLLFLPWVLRAGPAGLIGRRGVERTENDLALGPCLFSGRRSLNRLGVVRWSCAQSIPRGRHRGCRRATVSQRAAIREHQRGRQEQNAFRNHRDQLTIVAVKNI